MVDIFEQRIKAPFIPELEGEGDTANFDDYDEAPLIIKDFDMHAASFADFPMLENTSWFYNLLNVFLACP